MKAEYHFGLIGYPLGHSRSPILHQAAIEAVGAQGEYQLYSIVPGAEGQREIAALIDDMRKGLLDGLNVTIPHKQNVLPFLDGLTETAQAIGAVNTIYRDASGAVWGDNTDVPGFLKAIQPLMKQPQGKALVLGAGGSARAVVYGLAKCGWEVLIAARRKEQAENLATEIAQSQLEGRISVMTMPFSQSHLAGDLDLIVNSTPVGMFPHVDETPWPKDVPYPHAAVYDLIYNPLDTLFIRAARDAGLPTASGADMLVAQAALAFQRWTGFEPPFEVMGRAMANSYRLE